MTAAAIVQMTADEIAAEQTADAGIPRSNATVMLGVALELLIEEHVQRIGKGAGIVVRAATLRVAARAAARRFETPGEGIEQFSMEFWKAKEQRR